MAVTHMTGVSGSKYPFGRPGFRAKHEVVTAQVKLFQCQRVQLKHAAMPATASWELLQKRSFDWTRAKRLRKRFPVNDWRKKVGVGEHVSHCFHHTFATTVTHKPVVHDCNTCIFERWNSRRWNKTFGES